MPGRGAGAEGIGRGWDCCRSRSTMSARGGTTGRAAGCPASPGRTCWRSGTFGEGAPGEGALTEGALDDGPLDAGPPDAGAPTRAASTGGRGACSGRAAGAFVAGGRGIEAGRGVPGMALGIAGGGALGIAGNGCRGPDRI